MELFQSHNPTRGLFGVSIGPKVHVSPEPSFSTEPLLVENLQVKLSHDYGPISPLSFRSVCFVSCFVSISYLCFIFAEGTFARYDCGLFNSQ